MRYTFADLAPIVERSGCRIVRGTLLPDGDTAWHVECPTHAAKVVLLANLAELDSQQPPVIQLARDLAADTDHSPEGIAAALLAYVADRVDFLPEPIELFRPAETVLDQGIGDCDCSARAYLALARAAGLDAGLATLGQPPTHVAAVVQLGEPRGWAWAETSLRGAQLGEHPIAAARRLGVKVRPELAQLGALFPEVDGQRVDLVIQMASLAVLGLAGELASMIAHWRRPPLAEVVSVVVVGAWMPVLLHGLDRWLRPKDAQSAQGSPAPSGSVPGLRPIPATAADGGNAARRPRP